MNSENIKFLFIKKFFMQNSYAVQVNSRQRVNNIIITNKSWGVPKVLEDIFKNHFKKSLLDAWKWYFIAIIIIKYIITSLFYWRRQWQPTPVLLPGKSHGRRNLVGCSPWGRKELDTTELAHQQDIPTFWFVFTWLVWPFGFSIITDIIIITDVINLL